MSSIKKRVLEFLKNYQGSYIPQSHIHRALGVSKSRISEILRELESEGFIIRQNIGKSKIVYVNPGIFEKYLEIQHRVLKIGIVYSSEYLFLGGFIKRLKKRGFSVNILIYRDGLRASRALAEGLVHVTLSPLVGQLYLYPTYRTYRIILAGLQGGFRVLRKVGSSRVYSSMISTMDYVRYYSQSKGLVEASTTIYYSDPSNLHIARRDGGFVVTWHPVYLELEKWSFKTLYTPSDLDVEFCCTLGVSNTITQREYKILEKTYIEALDEYSSRPSRYIDYYSTITGIDTSILKSAIKEYSVSSELSLKTINKVLYTYTPTLPNREIYYEAITITEN
jgi:predicted transcriptional regulator